MKTLGIVAALLAVMAVAGFYYVRSRLVVETWEVLFEPARGASKRLHLDKDESLEAIRHHLEEGLLAALPAQPPESPRRVLQITLTLRVERRMWKVGLPPWSTISDSSMKFPCVLAFQPESAPVWILSIGDVAGTRETLGSSQQLLLDTMISEMRRHRELRRHFP